MATKPDEESIIEAERRVLQAICQGTGEGSVRETAKRVLNGYRWREPSHQVIFEVLLTIPSDVPQVIQEQLPARVTRRGFPDAEWEKIFVPHNLTREKAEGLMRKLTEADRL